MTARNTVLVCTVLAALSGAYAEDPNSDPDATGLAGIRTISLQIVHSEQAPALIDWDGYRNGAEKYLEQAGVGICDAQDANRPTTAAMIIRVELMAVPDANMYAVRIETDISRPVILPAGSRRIKASVAQFGGRLRLVEQRNLKISILEAMNAQVKTVAGGFKTVRKGHPNQHTDGADGTAESADSPHGTKTPPPVEAPYVASESSEVFHKSSCPSARRIAVGNIVGYKTREQAVAAGKRPCKRCKP